MIEARELRIGNLVYNETTMQNMEVYPMMITQLSRLEGETNIKPVPLTENMLLKFGFRKYMPNVAFRKELIDGFLIQLNFTSSSVECWIGNEILKTDIIYVHQLQNLYFALTGEELKR